MAPARLRRLVNDLGPWGVFAVVALTIISVWSIVAAVVIFGQKSQLDNLTSAQRTEACNHAADAAFFDLTRTLIANPRGSPAFNQALAAEQTFQRAKIVNACLKDGR